MTKIIDEINELEGGWKLVVIIGIVLIIKAIFELGFSFSFAI